MVEERGIVGKIEGEKRGVGERGLMGRRKGQGSDGERGQ